MVATHIKTSRIKACRIQPSIRTPTHPSIARWEWLTPTWWKDNTSTRRELTQGQTPSPFKAPPASTPRTWACRCLVSRYRKTRLVSIQFWPTSSKNCNNKCSSSTLWPTSRTWVTTSNRMQWAPPMASRASCTSLRVSAPLLRIEALMMGAKDRLKVDSFRGRIVIQMEFSKLTA